jgi:hypothetical protein
MTWDELYKPIRVIDVLVFTGVCLFSRIVVELVDVFKRRVR